MTIKGIVGSFLEFYKKLKANFIMFIREKKLQDIHCMIGNDIIVEIGITNT